MCVYTPSPCSPPTPLYPSPPLPFHLSCHVPYMHVYTILHACTLGVLIEWMCVYACMCSPFHHDITHQGSPSLRHTAGPVGQTCLPRLPSCPLTTALGAYSSHNSSASSWSEGSFSHCSATSFSNSCTRG